MGNIWRLFELVPSYKTRLARVLVVNSILGLVGLATPYLLKIVLDLVINSTSIGFSTEAIRQIYIGITALVGISLLGIIFDYIGERLSDLLFIDIMWEIRKKIFKHLSKLSVDYFEQNRPGEIMEKLSSGTTAFARWAFDISDGFLGVFITILLVTILLWVKIPIVGLIITIAVPLNFYLVINRIAKTKPLRESWSKFSEKGMGEMGETLAQISTVRSFAQEDDRFDRYIDQVNQYRLLRIEQFKVEWQTNALRGLLNMATFIGSIAYVAWGVIQGHQTVGDILMVSLYLQQIRGNIAPLSRIITGTGDVETAAGRLSTVLDASPTVTDHSDATELTEINSLEFRHVDFSYPGKGKKVLQNVSFRLVKGQTLALVGPSGVGKTTITKLILRFYEPTSGEILINDQPIANFTQESIRSLLGVVMQDVALFNDTIKNNIKFARPSATDAEITKSAITAHADVFIEKLSDGYETLVGERGIKLSGGEKQRIAIARALLRSPELVMLDEATSALDSQSEKYVQDGLAELMKSRTTIVIAHRLSTVMKSDKILVLKDGKLLETGTHQGLMAKKGLYHKLFTMQSKSHSQVL